MQFFRNLTLPMPPSLLMLAAMASGLVRGRGRSFPISDHVPELMMSAEDARETGAAAKALAVSCDPTATIRAWLMPTDSASPARSSPTTVPGATIRGMIRPGMESARRTSRLHFFFFGVHELRDARPGGVHLGHAAQVVAEKGGRGKVAHAAADEISPVLHEPQQLVGHVEGLEMDPGDLVQPGRVDPRLHLLDHPVQAVIPVAVHGPQEHAVLRDEHAVGAPGVDADGIRGAADLPAVGAQSLHDVAVDEKVVPVGPLLDPARSGRRRAGWRARG